MATPTLPDKYTELSERYIQQAEEEFQKGDLCRASEKAWNAVAHAIKAIGEQRGWRHDSQERLFAISGQIAEELDRPNLARLFRSVVGVHFNVYEIWRSPEHVRDIIDDARTFSQEMIALLRPNGK